MSNILKIAGAGVSDAAEETDPNFNQTVLLLHGDGTNGAQNNTFLDSSSNGFAITRNPATGPNAPTQGTFSPFSVGQKEWGTFFNGSSTSLRVPGTTVFQLGTGAFTCEAWISLSAYTTTAAVAPTSQYIVGTYDGASGGFAFFFLNDSGTYKLGFRNGDAGVVTKTFAFELNKFYHVAVSRDSSSVLRFFVNGTQIGADETGYTQNITRDNAFGCSVGRFILSQSGNPNGGYFSGSISNVRVVKGRAVYTSTFTPPTTPLSATSGGEDPPQGSETSLLMCQYSRFIDDSASPKTVTIQGTPKVTPFSPFAPTAAYDASVNGGSGYFDGSETYLQVSNAGLALGTGDFSIQFWVYNNAFDGASGNNTLFDYRNGSEPATQPLLFMNNGQLRYYVNGTLRITGSTLRLNEWSFIGLSRVSGTTKLFVNGVQSGSDYADSNNYTSSILRIAADYDLILNAGLNGYLSGFKITQGAAVDFSALGVPTAPPTNITNTSLLLNFTNAGIFDNTGKNNLETVGNAQIDTTTKKFGTGSMEFDGTGDYCLIPNSQELDFGSGDFTIEYWINFASLSGAIGVISKRAAEPNFAPFHMEVDSSTLKLFMSTSGSAWAVNGLATSTLSTGVWYHIAVVRNGTTVYLFVDGTSVGSTGTATGALMTNTTPVTIGQGAVTISNSVALNGYIDDLRITKGVARYTTTFTPPTKAFPDL